MNKLYSCVAVVFAILLLTPAHLYAQVSSGSISGDVRDPSQSVIPNATVTLIDVKTATNRTATTDAQGEFTFPQVNPGLYALTVQAAGFAMFREENIDLHVNQSYKIDANLKLSGNTSQVTVTASDLNVNTESSEVSSLISPRQMTEIPLNGRNFLQLLTIIPGSSPGNNLVTFQTGLLSTTHFSLSGTGDDAGVYTVDGAQMRDPGGNNVLPVFPSIDAIQEFRVQTNSYGPQFGGGGGAQVNILTKSGGNQFHGNLYEFGRNDAFDANAPLLKRNDVSKGKLRYNDYGYTVGGPVKTDKLFFFFSQEFRKQEIGVPRSGTVPTMGERVGDFSADAANYNAQQCYTSTPGSGNVTPVGGCGTYASDPNTGKPLGWVADGAPLNTAAAVIPANEISAAGSAFLKLYPNPTTSNPFLSQNWVESVNVPINTTEESVRGDYKFSETASLLVRYTHDSWVNGPNAYAENLWGEDGFPTVSDTWSSPGTTVSARFTQVKGSAVNTIGYSLTKSFTSIGPGNGAAENQAAIEAIPTFFQHPGQANHATFWGNGYSGLYNNLGFYNDTQTNGFSDDYAKVIGRHSLVAGVVYDYGEKNDITGGSTQATTPQFGGAYGFNDVAFAPTFVHNGTADLLTKGDTFGFGESDILNHVGARANSLEFYAGDTYKLTPTISANYGVRWSFLRMPYAAKNNIASFYPGAWTAANASSSLDGLLTPTNSGGFGRSLVGNQNNNIAPRVGISWDVNKNGKLVVRSGFGEFFATVQSSGQFVNLGANPPFVKTLTGVRYLDSATGFTYGGDPIDASQAFTGQPSNGINPNLQTPRTYQWNLTVAEQLTPNNTFQVAYVGNRGVHNYIKVDINQVLPENRAACVQTRLLSGNCGAYRPYGAGVLGDNGVTYMTWAGNSSYHALQASYEGRFGKNTQVHVNYTWSKLNGDTGLTDIGASPTTTDTYNPGYDRGLLQYDRTHIFSANYIYTSPELRGYNPALRAVAGSWEISGITTIDSGLPLTIAASPNFDYTGIGNIRPDRAPGVSETGPKNRLGTWINPNAYTVTNHALGALGNLGRGTVRGPGIAGQDLALVKNWHLPWIASRFMGDGSTFQFRVEMFNAFNHSQGTGVDTNYGIAAPVFSTDGSSVSFTQTTNGDFGKITSYRDPRQIQFGGKFNW